MKAYCWRNGVIETGRTVPKGAIKIAEAPARILNHQLTVLARHGYGPGGNGKLLVPGIPEAESETNALAALKRFQDRLHQGLAPDPNKTKAKGAWL